MNATRTRDAGFTLIELMVVVVIVGIVSSIALVEFMNALDKSRQRATMSDMRTISKAIEAYGVDHNRVPDSTGGIVALTGVLIPYQTSIVPVHDHWRHTYNYESTPAVGAYTIESYGKDGLDGSDITWATRWQFDLDIVLSEGLFLAAPE
jgi:general secretion pathway protein G